MSAGLPAALGEVIDGYRLDAVVGQGVLGCVYAAAHVKLNSPAAVKVVGRGWAEDPTAVGRWMKEARATSALRHPNIVEVIGFVPEAHRARLSCVTELLGGPSIASLLRTHPLTLRQSIGVALQVSSALHAAHKAGVVHRDLKPGNVSLVGAFDPSGHAVPVVKLTDFGIPRVTPFGGSGALTGTPAYMAPEQAAGGTAGTAADVYALGALLYELLTREALFAGADHQVLEAKRARSTPPIRLAGVEHAAELAYLLGRMLARGEGDRPTLFELKEALGVLLEALPPPRPHERPAGSRPRPAAEPVDIVLEAPEEAAPLAESEALRAALVGDLFSPPPGALPADRPTPSVRPAPARGSVRPEGPAEVEVEVEAAVEAEAAEVLPTPSGLPTRAQVRRPTDRALGSLRPTHDGPIIDTSAVSVSAERLPPKRPSRDDLPRPPWGPPDATARHPWEAGAPSSDPLLGSASSPPAAAWTPHPSNPPRAAGASSPPLGPVQTLERVAEPARAVLPRPPRVDAAPAAWSGPEVASARLSHPTLDESMSPPPRASRRLTVLAILSIAMLVASIVLVLVPELSDRATRAMTRRAARMSAGSSAVKNPLLEDIERWRVHHVVDTKTTREHLEEARRISREDSWRSSQAAEVELKLALVQEPNNPRALAMFLENRFLWRAVLLTAEEQRQMQEAMVFCVRKSANDAEVLRAGAAMARMRGDALHCREHAAEALRLTPDDPRTRLLLGWCEVETEPLRAVEMAEAVLAVSPELREAHRLLARAYANVGRYGAALRTLDERLRTDPSGGRAMLLRGDLKVELGRFAEAERDYQDAVNAEPENPLPRMGLAAAQLELGRAKPAVNLYKLVTANRSASEPLKAAANVGAARAYIAAGELLRAEQCVAEAQAAGGDTAAQQLVAAELSLARGALEQAAAAAERAVAAAPASSAALVLRGRVRLGERKVDLALADLQAALALDPRDHRLRAVVVASALAAGAQGLARAVLADALKFDPSGLYANATEVALELPFTVLRAAELELAGQAKLRSKPAEARVAQGMLDYALGRTETAAEAFAEVATATTSLRRLALAFEAQLALDGDQLPRAEKAVGRLLREDASSYVGLLLAARVAALKKDSNGARASFQAALASAPEGLAAKAELAALSLQETAEGGRAAALFELSALFRAHPRVVRIRQLLADAGH